MILRERDIKRPGFKINDSSSMKPLQTGRLLVREPLNANKRAVLFTECQSRESAQEIVHNNASLFRANDRESLQMLRATKTLSNWLIVPHTEPRNKLRKKGNYPFIVSSIEMFSAADKSSINFLFNLGRHPSFPVGTIVSSFSWKNLHGWRTYGRATTTLSDWYCL